MKLQELIGREHSAADGFLIPSSRRSRRSNITAAIERSTPALEGGVTLGGIGAANDPSAYEVTSCKISCRRKLRPEISLILYTDESTLGERKSHRAGLRGVCAGLLIRGRTTPSDWERKTTSERQNQSPVPD